MIWLQSQNAYNTMNTNCDESWKHKPTTSPTDKPECNRKTSGNLKIHSSDLVSMTTWFSSLPLSYVAGSNPCISYPSCPVFHLSPPSSLVKLSSPYGAALHYIPLNSDDDAMHNYFIFLPISFFSRWMQKNKKKKHWVCHRIFIASLDAQRGYNCDIPCYAGSVITVTVPSSSYCKIVTLFQLHHPPTPPRRIFPNLFQKTCLCI